MSYDYDYYSGRDLEYPRLSVKRPIWKAKPTPAEARAYADGLEAYEAAKPAYDVAVSEYNEKINERLAAFRNELKIDYCLTDAEFAAIWTVAWDRGHASGLSEVVNEFDDLFNVAINFYKARSSR